MKFETITFNDDTEITLGKINILVGPNNVGKSQVLRELNNYCKSASPKGIVLKNATLILPQTFGEMLDTLQPREYENPNGELLTTGLLPNLRQSFTRKLNRDWKEQWNRDFEKSKSNGSFLSYWGDFYVTHLKTVDRLNMIQTSNTGDLDQVQHLLGAFYLAGPEVEKEVSEALYKNFGLEVKIDYSKLNKLTLRINEQLDSIPNDPREQLKAFADIERIDDQGDGIKCFLAILMALRTIKRSILLIDEPEAFLHPPQAMAIGESIAKQIDDDSQIFIATHSSDFLRGILNISTEINLLRIDREGEKNRVTNLEPEAISSIYKDPILSSVRLIEGFFYKAVVVCESDSDATFYQRVSRKLELSDEVHFVHAHNKQSLYKFCAPYISADIPFALVADIDLFRVHHEFKRLVKDLQVGEIDTLLELRASLCNFIEAATPLDIVTKYIGELEDIVISLGDDSDPNIQIKEANRKLKGLLKSGDRWAQIKREGVSFLDNNSKKTFAKLNRTLREKGLFVVPVGELEGWLADIGLDYSTNKSNWITSALTELSDMDKEALRKSSVGKFVKRLHRFLIN